MKFKFKKGCIFLICVTLSLVINSCSDSSSAKKKKLQELMARKAERQREADNLLKEKQLKLELAKQEAKEKAMKAMEAKRKSDALLLEEQEAKQRIADKKERLRLEDIRKRQLYQKQACEKFIGTNFVKLILVNGRVLKSAKVLEATPLKVKFAHESGVAHIAYSNLPKEIAKKCNYSEELGKLELERLNPKKYDTASVERPSNTAKTISSNSKNNSGSSQELSKLPFGQIEVKAVKPKGKVSVNVVNTNNRGKIIRVIVRANVDAVVALNDYRLYRSVKYNLKANEVFNYLWKNVDDNYDVKLTANRQILDSVYGKKRDIIKKNNLKEIGEKNTFKKKDLLSL